jgi:hypothetical protein
MVHGLFLYDVLQEGTGWKALDDIIHFTYAITITEFVVSVLVVGSGGFRPYKCK